jgi:hypothetical protein
MDEGPVTDRPVLYDRSVATLRLQQVAPGEEDDPLAFGMLALEAVFALGDVIEPLALEVTFACVDRLTGYPETSPGPPVRAVQLVPRDLPKGVVPLQVHGDAQTLRCAHLDLDAVIDPLEVGLRQRCPGGAGGSEPELVTTWHEMWVTASAVRLPASLAQALTGADHLTLRAGVGEVTQPLERRADQVWAAGPVPPSIPHAPLELRARNESGFFTLTLSRAWSIWSPDGPGAEDVRGIAVRLGSAGWLAEEPNR